MSCLPEFPLLSYPLLSMLAWFPDFKSSFRFIIQCSEPYVWSKQTLILLCCLDCFHLAVLPQLFPVLPFFTAVWFPALTKLVVKVHIFSDLNIDWCMYECVVNGGKKIPIFLMSTLLYHLYYIILKDLFFRNDSVWVVGTIETYELLLQRLGDCLIRNTKDQVR